MAASSGAAVAAMAGPDLSTNNLEGLRANRKKLKKEQKAIQKMIKTEAQRRRRVLAKVSTLDDATLASVIMERERVRQQKQDRAVAKAKAKSKAQAKAEAVPDGEEEEAVPDGEEVEMAEEEHADEAQPGQG